MQSSCSMFWALCTWQADRFISRYNKSESDSGGRVCESREAPGAVAGAACPARAGSRRPQWCRSLRGCSRWDPAGWQAISPPATAGAFREPLRGFLS